MIRGDLRRRGAVRTRRRARARAPASTPTPNLGPLLDDPPPDADPEVLKRLRQMYEAGGWVLVESALADLPGDLRWLFESGAVTIEQLAALHRALGVDVRGRSRARRSREQRDPRASPASTPSVEAAIARGAARRCARRFRAFRSAAPSTIAEPVLERLRASPACDWAEPVGSLRRGQDTVGDIEIVAATAQPGRGDRRAARALPDVVARAAPQRAPAVRADRSRAGRRAPAGAGERRRGAALPHRIARRTSRRCAAHAAATRLAPRRPTDCTAPTARCGRRRPKRRSTRRSACRSSRRRSATATTRSSAASRGELPALVSRGDIRGDLHMHTLWSDGRDSIEAMVQACVALGYEYMAITDHSPHSAAIAQPDASTA